VKRILNNIIFKIKNPDCILDNSASVSRKFKVGNNCKIGRGCILASTVTLGNNVIIGGNTCLKNLSVGNNTMIEGGVKVVGPGKGNISIGEECYIGVNNVFDTSDNITIGDFVHIAGPSTGLWCHSSAEMCINSIPLEDKNRDKYRPTSPIIIESNVYIGGNCTIYPGVKIGHHSIIAPNSAVTKDVESFKIMGGVPARIIKKIT